MPTKAVNESCSKVAKVISLTGSVAYKPATTHTWYKLNVNVNLCPNDQIRVGTNSRTSIHLNNNTVIRLKENSLLKLSPTKENKFVNLFQGIGHFISHVKKSFEVRTPLINAFVEGTEFLVSITPEQGKVAVLQGKVRTYNPHGAVSVAKGQTAVAKVGKAPVLQFSMYNSLTKPNYTQDQLNRRQTAESNRRQTESNPANSITTITSSQYLYTDNEGAGAELVAPLNRSNNSFVFFNPKVYFNSEQSVISLGAGIRSTNSYPFNVGVNAFFDASKTEETFTQYGLGLEIFNDIFSFSANYYQPTEEYKIAKTSTTTNSYSTSTPTVTYNDPTFAGHEIYQEEVTTTVNADVTNTNVFDTFEYTNKGFDLNLNIKLNKYITASLGYEEYEAFEEPFNKDKFSRSSASLDFALSKNLSLSLTGYDDEHDRDEKYHAVLTYNFKPQKTAHLNRIAAPVKRYNKGIKVFITDPILNTDKSVSTRTITSTTEDSTTHTLKENIFYVDDDGIAGGDCTFETNCASITQAAALATAGATVFVTDGIYNENAAFGNGIDLTSSFDYTDLQNVTHTVASTNNPQINGGVSIGGDSRVNGFNIDRTTATITASISDNQTIEITNNVVSSEREGIIVNGTITDTNITAIIDNNEVHSILDGIQTNYVNNLTITNNNIITNELGIVNLFPAADAIRVLTGNGGTTTVNNNTAVTNDPALNASSIELEASIASSTHCVIAESNKTSSSTGFGLGFSNTNVSGGTILNVQGLANMEALNPELEFNDDTDKVSSSSATDITACP